VQSCTMGITNDDRGLIGLIFRFRFLTKLELFEWVGICASIVAGFIFFAYAGKLDSYAGAPGYHWHMLFVILLIYGKFIPYAILAGACGLFLVGFWMRRNRKELVSRFGYTLRIFLAYCLLLIVFRVVNFYVPVLTPGIRDAAIQSMDKVLFGNQVSNMLEPISTHWLTNILTGAYVSWFWLLFATILILSYRNRLAASEYLLATLLAFYTGYACYVLIPVIGPGFTMHFTTTLGDIAPVYTTSRLFIARDCFPSLHTATSVLMAIYIAKYQRKWLYFYAPMVTLIIFATLYLRIHYGADDLAGAMMAIVISAFTTAVFQLWERFRKV
jgi:membrane-associated phospholipid phosphatase